MVTAKQRYADNWLRTSCQHFTVRGLVVPLSIQIESTEAQSVCAEEMKNTPTAQHLIYSSVELSVLSN